MILRYNMSQPKKVKYWRQSGQIRRLTFFMKGFKLQTCYGQWAGKGEHKNYRECGALTRKYVRVTLPISCGGEAATASFHGPLLDPEKA